MSGSQVQRRVERGEGVAVPDPVQGPPGKTRADMLGNGAEAAKRGAEALIEAEHGRGRLLAAAAAAGGVLALVLAAAGALGVGDPRVFNVLAGIAALAPTALAVVRASEGEEKGWSLGSDRGLCLGIATHARRLGDAVGAADERNIPLTGDAVINGQLDILFKDLDKARQRLASRGADLGARASGRGSDRIVPDKAETLLTGEDGRRYPVWIAELSLTGVVVRGGLPPLGARDLVQVGNRRARVVAVDGNRATLQFATPIVAAELNRRIVL